MSRRRSNRRASDVEELRAEWEEYAFELRDEREDYVKKMAKRGYRGIVDDRRLISSSG